MTWNNDIDVLVLHDFFFSVGGAEWDAIKTARHFNAPIATFDPPTRSDFEDIQFIDLGSVSEYPFGARESRIWIESIIRSFRGDFDEYDLILVNKDWSKSVARATETPVLYYCHSPERHLYDFNKFRYNWLKERSLTKALSFKLFTGVMRPLDRGDINHIDKVVCNSQNIQKRCEKYYNMSPDVVYPPVETQQFQFDRVGDYWLNVSRLGPGKRIEFLIETFNNSGEELKVIGSPDREEYLQKYEGMADGNVEFLGGVSWDELKEHYSSCKGLVTVARDEDFGLTPVEAMASGKAVIAVNEGGYRETVVDGETGWLLPLDKERFRSKISNIDKSVLKGMRERCLKRAEDFDEQVYYREMGKKIKETIE